MTQSIYFFNNINYFIRSFEAVLCYYFKRYNKHPETTAQLAPSSVEYTNSYAKTI